MSDVQPLSTRPFPIMGDDNIKSVPWWVVQSCEGQILRNHGQSLETLARRGGLDVIELGGALTGRSWSKLGEIAAIQGRAVINRRLEVQK